MYKPDILDEIIDSLAPETIPAEFILMAKVRTYDGLETILTGPEFEKVMETQGDQIADIRVIIDVKKVRHVITTMTNEIFAAAREL